jgi:NAD(P)-dependent dehydrogenase (short-subunit alcohol dehydrogenase family)
MSRALWNNARLLVRGCRHEALVARKAPDVEKTVHVLRDAGRKAHGCAADLSTGDGRRAVRARVDEIWGELHVLVNNLGMNIRAPTLDYPIESLRQLMSANLESAFGRCQLMHPHLRASRGAGTSARGSRNPCFPTSHGASASSSQPRSGGSGNPRTSRASSPFSPCRLPPTSAEHTGRSTPRSNGSVSNAVPTPKLSST